MATDEVINYEYQFEIETILTQFLALIDNAIIMRYEKNPETGERTLVNEIMPTYIVGPKQRIVYHLTNKNKNYTLPCIGVTLTGIKADKERLLDKTSPITRMYEGELEGYQRPAPITLTVKMTVWAKFMSDIYQVFGKIATQFQPYAVYSWAVPAQNGFSYEELRNKVEWDMNLALETKEQLQESDEDKFAGTMTFTIQGWLFPQFKRCVEGIILDIGSSIISEGDVEARTIIDGLNANQAFRPLVDQYVEEYQRPYKNPREFATAHPHLLRAYTSANTKNDTYNFLIVKGESVTHDFFNGAWSIRVKGYQLDECKAMLVPASTATVKTDRKLIRLNYGESVLFPRRDESSPKPSTVRGYDLEVKSQNRNGMLISLAGF